MLGQRCPLHPYKWNTHLGLVMALVSEVPRSKRVPLSSFPVTEFSLHFERSSAPVERLWSSPPSRGYSLCRALSGLCLNLGRVVARTSKGRATKDCYAEEPCHFLGSRRTCRARAIDREPPQDAMLDETAVCIMTSASSRHRIHCVARSFIDPCVSNPQPRQAVGCCDNSACCTSASGGWIWVWRWHWRTLDCP